MGVASGVRFAEDTNPVRDTEDRNQQRAALSSPEPGAVSLKEDERKVRETVFRLATEHPELLDDVQETRDFSEQLEDDPDLFGEAQEFLEAISGE